ncbi:hypothetical protein YSY43_03580 [Paenibacillus sp. YSY-4.3]
MKQALAASVARVHGPSSPLKIGIFLFYTKDIDNQSQLGMKIIYHVGLFITVIKFMTIITLLFEFY